MDIAKSASPRLADYAVVAHELLGAGYGSW